MTSSSRPACPHAILNDIYHTKARLWHQATKNGVSHSYHVWWMFKHQLSKLILVSLIKGLGVHVMRPCATRLVACGCVQHAIHAQMDTGTAIQK